MSQLAAGARPDATTSPPGRIEVHDFGFRHLARERWAVRGVSFTVEPGERVLLLGPSGSGKSTLLSAVAGLLDEESGDVEGTIRVDGVIPTAGHSRAAIVFQDPDSQLVMSRCGDEVAFGLENAGVPRAQIWPRVCRALASVGFGYDLDRPTHALSGGERQRLVLAGAIALEPGILLLDEPTANLDPAGTRAIIDAVRAVTEERGTTVLMIEHKVPVARPLVDRVIVVGPEGGLLADGPAAEVLTEQGQWLAAQGVWVDATPPYRPRPATLTASAALLHADRPQRRYATGGPLLPAPTDLTLTTGRVTALVGPNGAGKSTLAMMVAGLRRPASGAVRATSALAGRQPGKPPHTWKAARLAERIGTVFQNPEHQFLTASVRAEISLGPLRSGATDAHERAQELLERLGLAGLADANPFTLSGGEKRRLSVATALATRPRVLVLDEPTFGQDRRTWAELCALFARQRDAGSALLLVSHDDLLVDVLADDVVEMRSAS